MTFATLRALHALIGQAIDDIERAFAAHGLPLEFPSLEEPVYHPPAHEHQSQNPDRDAIDRAGRDKAEDVDINGGIEGVGGADSEERQRQDDKRPTEASDSERERKEAAEALLATHPAVMAATNRIVAAAGHIAACVRDPFLSLCDASMGYHLPACMRFLEATHIVEVLREAGEHGDGDGGMHVSALSARIGVPEGRLAHILRLLATHHILTELSPDVFANNRLSSRLDSGKRAADLLGCSPASPAPCASSSPEMKCPAYARPSCEKASRDHGDALSRTEESGSDAGAPHTKPNSKLDPNSKSTGHSHPHPHPHAHAPSPAAKYESSNGVAAFVGLCTDELFKAAAYMAEAYVPALAPAPPSPSPAPAPAGGRGAEGAEVAEVAPFGHAFGTRAGYFAWLEDGGRDPRLSPVLPAASAPSPRSPAFSLAPSSDSGLGWGADERGGGGGVQDTRKGSVGSGVGSGVGVDGGRGADSEEGRWLKGKGKNANANAHVQAQPASPPPGSRRRFRLERFGKAMTGSSAWEPPAGLLNSAFDWTSLAPGSILVDVGGGVGSASIALAARLGTRVRFVVQDRERVCAMGRASCDPGLLESGAVRFDAHDFFARQPITAPAVFLLRAILHDWPDDEAARILRRLRDAAGAGTKLIIADHVLPLACADDFGGASGGGDGEGEGEGVEVEGAERMLAPPPLLANLGKASANAYWMDMTMHAMFNAKERTLRELVALARDAGWKVVRVARAQGSLFAHVVAVPCAPPAPVAAPWACEFAEVEGLAEGLGLGLGSAFSPTVGTVTEEERDEFESGSGSIGGGSGPVSPSVISPSAVSPSATSPNGGVGVRRVVRKRSSLAFLSSLSFPRSTSLEHVFSRRNK